MYEAHFGLDRPPFKITPDTSLFYEGGKRGDILAGLEYAIHRGEGIIKVVGEVGSGKTMLCRMLQLRLPDTVEIVYIANPSVSPEDILFVIAHELSLPVTRDASKHEVMHLLQDYLLRRHTENKQVVLFVEEAQSMPIETLEEIRLLSNLETDLNKLLQIILFGQPELNQNLAKQSIRQLRERITHNFDLKPLTRTEIHNYLNFRMREVGYTGPELINRVVAQKVEQHSLGLLRRINIIADKLLLSAFAEGTHNLTAKHVTAAVDDSAFDQISTRRWLGFRWRLAGSMVVLVLLVGSTQLSSDWLLEGASEVAARLNSGDIASQAAIKVASPVHTEVTPAQPEETAPQVDFSEMTSLADDLDPPTATNPSKTAQSEMRQTAKKIQHAEVESASLVKRPRVTVSAPTKPKYHSSANASPEIDLMLRQALARRGSNVVLTGATGTNFGLSADHSEWLDAKLRQSREWLSKADRDNVSIQVLMRNKSAVRELVDYLRHEWPLDLSKTYLYAVGSKNQGTYRVYYDEFDSLTRGRVQLSQLPESVKKNSPYLDSVYRMQQALL